MKNTAELTVKSYVCFCDCWK